MLPSKIIIDHNGDIIIRNLDKNEYDGIGNNVVSFALNEMGDGITVTEECDMYYETTLNKGEIDLLISMLNNLKEQIN